MTDRALARPPRRNEPQPPRPPLTDDQRRQLADLDKRFVGGQITRETWGRERVALLRVFAKEGM